MYMICMCVCICINIYALVVGRYNMSFCKANNDIEFSLKSSALEISAKLKENNFSSLVVGFPFHFNVFLDLSEAVARGWSLRCFLFFAKLSKAPFLQNTS